MISKAEAIAYLLPGLCGSCGSALPEPGQPCSACGRIPEVTAAELEGQLNGPLALAAVEAKKIEAEAIALHEASVEKFRAASEVVFVARLQARRDQAQRAFDQHQHAHKTLYGPRTAARRAEERAASELAKAAAEHEAFARAEELARRMKHGVTAETEAALRLEKASVILRRYQDELAAATAKREQADAALAQSAARGAMLERARDKAVAAVMNPGRIPLGKEAILASPFRLLMSGRLDEAETMMAGIAGRAICAATGVTDDIVSEARRDLLAELQKQGRDRPLHLQNLGGGKVSAVPNPLATGTPQPFHPAQYPAGQVTPAATPGWS